MTGSVLESDLIDGVTTAPYVCEGGFCGAVTPSAYTQSKPTWRISLDQKFSTDIMGYVSYNRGFKSGGFNAKQPLPANPYRPAKGDAFELGVKTELFDHRLRLNTSFFYTRYSNLRVDRMRKRLNSSP